jgi:type III restriction enzyme
LAHLKHFLNKEDMQIKWMYMCDDLRQWDTNDKIKLINKNRWKDEWKHIAKLPNSQIDVIIFKMVITEGWDIRRANMLFQIRETDSETLTEQVIGRIRRNPILLNWSSYSEQQQEIAMQSYVWGQVKDKDREFKRIKSVDNPKIEVLTTVLDNLENVYKKQRFELDKFISDKTLTNVNTIFELYGRWSFVEDDTFKMTWEHIKTYDDWIKFSNFIQEIDYKNKELLKDYGQSIKTSKKVGLPEESYFEILKIGPNNMQFGPCDIDIINDKFGWKIISDNDDIDFFFDSQAEREFANKIKRVGKKVWAKNFYPNSHISFEYINVTKKKSFPDFILLGKNGHYHIFEVKSFNESRTHNIDPEEYNEKVMALREFYKELAGVTNYTFYIPIRYKDDWVVYKYQKGNEEWRNIGEIIESIELDN